MQLDGFRAPGMGGGRGSKLLLNYLPLRDLTSASPRRARVWLVQALAREAPPISQPMRGH